MKMPICCFSIYFHKTTNRVFLLHFIPYGSNKYMVFMNYELGHIFSDFVMKNIIIYLCWSGGFKCAVVSLLWGSGVRRPPRVFMLTRHCKWSLIWCNITPDKHRHLPLAQARTLILLRQPLPRARTLILHLRVDGKFCLVLFLISSKMTYLT